MPAPIPQIRGVSAGRSGDERGVPHPVLLQAPGKPSRSWFGTPGVADRLARIPRTNADVGVAGLVGSRPGESLRPRPGVSRHLATRDSLRRLRWPGACVETEGTTPRSVPRRAGNPRRGVHVVLAASQFEPIQHHHLVPRPHGVAHELLLRVVGGHDLGGPATAKVGPKDRGRCDWPSLAVAGCAIATLVR